MIISKPFKIIIIGVSIMLSGATMAPTAFIEVTSIIAGFMISMFGLLKGLRETHGSISKKPKRDRDTPMLVRITGLLIALVSLSMPYTRSILTHTHEHGFSLATIMSSEAAYSAEIVIPFLVLVSLIAAGAFISIFHHIGGYIILLSALTITFMNLFAMGTLQLAMNQLEIGVYLAIIAGLLIIFSSLIKPKTGIDPGSDWARGA